MGRLSFFNRKLPISSDDLYVPVLYLVILRFIWTGVIAYTLSIVIKECHWSWYISEYLVTFLILNSASLIIEAVVCVLSTRGTIVDQAPRRAIGPLSHVGFFLITLNLIWQVFGIYIFYGPFIDQSQASQHCVEDPSSLSVNLMYVVLIWGVITSFGFYCIFGIIIYGSRRNRKGTTDMAKYLQLWQRRVLWFFSSPHSRQHEGKKVILNFARELAEYTRDVDLSATDIAVGLILLKREQKMAREAWEAREADPNGQLSFEGSDLDSNGSPYHSGASAYSARTSQPGPFRLMSAPMPKSSASVPDHLIMSSGNTHATTSESSQDTPSAPPVLSNPPVSHPDTTTPAADKTGASASSKNDDPAADTNQTTSEQQQQSASETISPKQPISPGRRIQKHPNIETSPLRKEIIPMVEISSPRDNNTSGTSEHHIAIHIDVPSHVGPTASTPMHVEGEDANRGESTESEEIQQTVSPLPRIPISPLQSRHQDRRASHHIPLERVHTVRDRWLSPELRPGILLSPLAPIIAPKDSFFSSSQQRGIFGVGSSSFDHQRGNTGQSRLNHHRPSLVTENISRRMSFSTDFRTHDYFESHTATNSNKVIKRGDILDVLHFAHYAQIVYINFDAINHKKIELLVHMSPKNDLFMSPYLISIDHEWRAVVIAIRGTFSLADVLVDLAIDLEPLDPPDESHSGKVYFVHSGMLRAARNIFNDIVSDSQLAQVLQNPDSLCLNYGIVVCGHSLGAGIAAIVAYLLRKSGFMSTKCYAYEPPGSLLCADSIPVFEDFCVSVVTGDDVVPRLNRNSLDVLKTDLRRLINACETPKYKVFGSVIFNACRGPSEKTRIVMNQSRYRAGLLAKVEKLPVDQLRRIRRHTISIPKSWRTGSNHDSSASAGRMSSNQSNNKSGDQSPSNISAAPSPTTGPKEPESDPLDVMASPPMFMPGRILYIEKLRGFSVRADHSDSVIPTPLFLSPELMTPLSPPNLMSPLSPSIPDVDKSTDDGAQSKIDTTTPDTSDEKSNKDDKETKDGKDNKDKYASRSRTQRRRRGNASLMAIKQSITSKLEALEPIRRPKDYRYVYVPRWAKHDEFQFIIVSRSMMSDHSSFGMLREFEDSPSNVPLQAAS